MFLNFPDRRIVRQYISESKQEGEEADQESTPLIEDTIIEIPGPIGLAKLEHNFPIDAMLQKKSPRTKRRINTTLNRMCDF